MKLNDVTDPNSLSSKLRGKRDVRLRELITEISAQKGSISILDVGGTVEYWQRLGLDFVRAQKATIVVTNLVPSELTGIVGNEDVFSMAVVNGCDMSIYSDGEFDLVHSNSVIEHVGDWANMRAFAAESRRVGRNYYVQTPNFWCPIDPHYYKAPMMHWLPHPWRARVFNSFAITYSGKKAQGVDEAYRIIDSTRLIDGRQFRYLFPDAQVSTEWFFGLPKSHIGVRTSA